MHAQIANNTAMTIAALKVDYATLKDFNEAFRVDAKKWDEAAELAAQMQQATEAEKANQRLTAGSLATESELGADDYSTLVAALESGHVSREQVNDLLQKYLSILHNEGDFNPVKLLLVTIAEHGGESWASDLNKIKGYISALTPYQPIVKQTKKKQPDGSTSSVWACNLKKQKAGKWIERPAKFWNKITKRNEKDGKVFTEDQAYKGLETFAEKANGAEFGESMRYSLVATLAKELGLESLSGIIAAEVIRSTGEGSGE